ncbi:MAG: HVO_A0114 family putative DNA-binding protein [Acidithiobacillus sp.]
MRQVQAEIRAGYRALLRVIREAQPESINALAEMTGRKPGNLSRTLKSMSRYGFVEMLKEQRQVRHLGGTAGRKHEHLVGVRSGLLMVPVGTEHHLCRLHNGRGGRNLQILLVFMKSGPVEIGGADFHLVTRHHIIWHGQSGNVHR